MLPNLDKSKPKRRGFQKMASYWFWLLQVVRQNLKWFHFYLVPNIFDLTICKIMAYKFCKSNFRFNFCQKMTETESEVTKRLFGFNPATA